MKLLVLCDVVECGEAVDEDTVFDHFQDRHAIFDTDDWRFKKWPDDTLVLIDPETRSPA